MCMKTIPTKDVLTLEHVYLASSVVINIVVYSLLLTDTPCPLWIEHLFLWAASLLNVPLHAFAILASLGRFLLDSQRRQRMGASGILHTMANVTAFVLSYFILLPNLFPDAKVSSSMEAHESVVALLHGLSCIVSAVGAFGLVWMIPAVSKKHSRFFTCAILTSAVIGMAELSFFAPLECTFFSSGAFWALRTTFTFISTFLAFISFIDVLSSFVLVHFERRFKKTNQEAITHHRRSSARKYPATTRVFWRSFRKAEFMQYLFPQKDEAGAQRRTSIFNATHEHASVRPSTSWFIYYLGETGVNTSLLHSCFSPQIAEEVPNMYPTLFNFYAVVTFGVTLALKGILSTGQFKTLLAQCVFATSMLNLSSAPDIFLYHVRGLIIFGYSVMFTTWCLSENAAASGAKVAPSFKSQQIRQETIPEWDFIASILKQQLEIETNLVDRD